MDYNAAALEMHAKYPGKLTVNSLFEVKDRDALSTAYTPGVAEPCRQIKANPDDVYKYTFKGRTVAVVTNGTAVLGLGNIGPEAGLPVMEGKCVLFKEFGGVDAFPICLNAKTKEEVIAAVKAIAPTFGGINLEDIGAPACFGVEQTLKKKMNIPVFHDDQHGTAIISLAAILNALKIVGKKIEECRFVVNGAGAAGISCSRFYLTAGAKRENFIMCDSKGVIHRGRTDLNPEKAEFAAETSARTLEEAMKGADIFLGFSAPNCVTPDMVRSMAKDPIIFAMANPVPEIFPDVALAAGAAVVGTGRSDFPNQINNVLAFPGIFRGALDVRASDINDDMMEAAAYAIAGLVDDEHRAADYIIPGAFDKRVASAVAAAVADAARKSGVARI